MITEVYVRKPLIVEAVQVTPENVYDVAKWCEGEVHKSGDGSLYVTVDTIVAVDKRQAAYNEMWILKSSKGFKIYDNKSFKRGFQLGSGEERDKAVQDKKSEPAEIS